MSGAQRAPPWACASGPAGGHSPAASSRVPSSRSSSSRRVPLLQAGEPHRSELGAGEASYRMADVVQQPPHDPVAALVDHQLDDRAVPVGRAHLRGADLRRARRRGSRRRAAASAWPGDDARRPRRRRSCPPRTTGGPSGARSRRRWSAGSARRCRCRAGRRGRAARAGRRRSPTSVRRPCGSDIVETTPRGLFSTR